MAHEIGSGLSDPTIPISRSLLEAILDQAEQGALAEHSCPAVYACCAIVVDLKKVLGR